MSKLIIVPKDKDAEIVLDYNSATPKQLIELNLTNETFEKLWKEGIFSLINKVSNSNIDQFEDEHITDLKYISNSYIELKKMPGDLEDIIKMFELAITYNTSIHFYFLNLFKVTQKQSAAFSKAADLFIIKIKD